MINNKKIIIILIIIILVFIVLLYNYLLKLQDKKNYIMEASHNTAQDDRKLVKYNNFEILQDLTSNKIEFAKLLNNIDELITKDFSYIKKELNKENEINSFYENNKSIFKKDLCIIEISSLKNLYKKLNGNQNTNFDTDFETCKFENDSKNSINFEIKYSNNFTVSGLIVLADNGKIYLEF